MLRIALIGGAELFLGGCLTTKEPAGRGYDDTPVAVEADGPTEALATFVRDQFANQRLARIAAPRGG